MKNDSLKRIGKVLEEADSICLFPHENPDGDAIGSCAAIISMLRSMGKKCVALIDEELPDNLKFLDRDGMFIIGKSLSGADYGYVDGTEAVADSDCSNHGTSATGGDIKDHYTSATGGDTKDYCVNVDRGGNDQEMSAFDLNIVFPPDICMCVDCGIKSRFPERAEYFGLGKKNIAIDHHLVAEPFCEMNHIVPEASATGELIYKLMRAMGHTPTKEEGEAIFAAITTDSGNFQYSSTTKDTHKIICKLYDAGIDVTYVSTALYQNVSPEKLELESLAVEKMKFFASGKVVTSMITQAMLKETGAVMSDAEPIVATIRSVAGVEIALLFKERERGKIFVSMRAKTDADVQKLAVKFGGGGHKKAAGATIDGTMEEVMRKVTDAAVNSLG